MEKHLSCVCDQITASSPNCDVWVHTVFKLLGKHKAKLIGKASSCRQADPSQKKIRWINSV